MSELSHLKDLNKEQNEAVHAKGSVLVLAGAGAGKTKTITARIIHLITEGIDPENILAITFTNKAAQEMRERVRTALKSHTVLQKDLPRTPFVGTFHALCAQLLREFGSSISIPRSFSIADRSDSKKLIKEAMEDLGLDTKQYEPGRILSSISREKGDAHEAQSLTASKGNDFWKSLVARVWNRYDEKLKRENMLDFDDLLLKTVTLLENHADVRTALQKRWTHIHVDEYQDTNRVQYKLVRLIVEPRRDLFVVGDMDQTIYTWRGAQIQNLLNFEKDFPGASVVILEENYRSSKNILDAANAVIEKNTIRYKKTLRANKPAGETLGIFGAYDENEEASFVAGKAKELIEKGVSAGDIAVLYRANFQSRALEQAFLEQEVPYQVLGTRFFDRKEVKDVLAFIRAGLNQDSSTDWKRIVSAVPRGIGKITLLKALAGKEDELGVAQRKKIADLKSLLTRIQEQARGATPSETVRFVIRESGIEHALSAKNTEDEERMENIKELVTVARIYDTLPIPNGIELFLSDAALSGEQDELKEKKSAVRLMTVHASKGLEFDYVFIVGLEDDLFPHAKDSGTGSIEEMEEERRLFYVALTRARKKIFLTYANVRTIFGMRSVRLPSEFFLDVDDALTNQETHQRHALKTIRFD